MHIQERFREIAKAALKEKGWTMTGVARRWGTTPAYVSGILANNSASIKKWEALFSLLGVTEEDIFGRRNTAADALAEVAMKLDELRERTEMQEATPYPAVENLLSDSEACKVLGIDEELAGRLRSLRVECPPEDRQEVIRWVSFLQSVGHGP